MWKTGGGVKTTTIHNKPKKKRKKENGAVNKAASILMRSPWRPSETQPRTEYTRPIISIRPGVPFTHNYCSNLSIYHTNRLWALMQTSVLRNNSNSNCPCTDSIQTLTYKHLDPTNSATEKLVLRLDWKIVCIKYQV